MRYFKHNIGDYAAATQHLSFVEDAAYHRMMRHYYASEKPLLSDLKALARVLGARTKEEKEAVATIANEFFTLESDGWHQRRCDVEIAAFLEKSSKAAEAGRKGGRPKREAKPLNGNETAKASASSPESVRSPDVKPPTTHQPLPTTHEREDHPAAASPVIPPDVAAAAAEDDLVIPAFLRRAPDGPQAAMVSRDVEDEAYRLWLPVAADLGITDPGFLNSARRPMLSARLAECGGIDGWKIAMERLRAAKFLIEDDGSPKHWVNLMTLCKPENFTGLMEGRYAERHREVADERSVTAGLAGLAEASSG